MKPSEELLDRIICEEADSLGLTTLSPDQARIVAGRVSKRTGVRLEHHHMRYGFNYPRIVRALQRRALAQIDWEPAT